MSTDNSNAAESCLPHGTIDVDEEGAAAQVLNNHLLSLVNSALDKHPRDCCALEVVEAIRTGATFDLAAKTKRIRDHFAEVLGKTGDRKAAKEAISRTKITLPAVLWSGRFRERNDRGLRQHSGLICADLDELGNDLPIVRAKLRDSLHILLMFISPSGDGLKCVFRIPSDSSRHRASFRAVAEHVESLTSVKIDRSCSNLSRLCFLSHDSDAWVNYRAVELPVIPPKQLQTPDVAVSVSGNAADRQQLAERLFGRITWTTATEGFCTCPGEHLHTTANKETDCKVYLDAEPNVFCFHNSCRDARLAKTQELRTYINNAESRNGQALLVRGLLELERPANEDENTLLGSRFLCRGGRPSRCRLLRHREEHVDNSGRDMLGYRETMLWHCSAAHTQNSLHSGGERRGRPMRNERWGA